MLHKLFTVFDMKSESYMAPFMMRTVGECQRTLTNMLTDVNQPFSRNPEDFVVYELGTFHIGTGVVVLLPAPTSLFALSSLKAPA